MSNDERSLSDPVSLALEALAWIATDPDRLGRLLGLTGLDAAGLRARAADPALLAAAIGFLEAHEPDLLACADAIGRQPSELVRARAEIDP